MCMPRGLNKSQGYVNFVDFFYANAGKKNKVKGYVSTLFKKYFFENQWIEIT